MTEGTDGSEVHLGDAAPAVDHVRMAQVLSAFASNLVRSYDAQAILDELCRTVAEILPVDGAGVMLDDDEGKLRFVAASDEVVRRIEGLQIELGEGPCLQAARTGQQVVVPDLAAPKQPFVRFAPRALEVGLRAVYSFPMGLAVEHGPIGALNLYRGQPARWLEEHSVTGQLLADVATGYIVNARVAAQQATLSAQLQRALESRVAIEQAKGKLSVLLDCSPTEAFERMRTVARRSGRKLHDIARGVMDGTVRID